jgi:hypothetical protein
VLAGEDDVVRAFEARHGCVVPGGGFHWGKLDDTVACLQHCSFFVTRRASPIPVVHVLSKALPQRCQFRSLGFILQDYARRFRTFDVWLRKVTLCAMGGYYPHCKVRPPPTIRVDLYTVLFATPLDVWTQWIHDHTYLLFYILKEALCVLVRIDPALHEVLRDTYYWDVFESTARGAMDVARTMLVVNRTRFPARDSCFGIRPELVKRNNAQLKFAYKIPQRDFVVFMERVTQSVRQKYYEAWLADDARPDFAFREAFVCNDALEKFIRTVVAHRHWRPKVPNAVWLRLFGLHPDHSGVWESIERDFHVRDLSVSAVVRQMKALPLAAFAVMNYFCGCMYNLQAVTLVHLPAHYYRAHDRVAGDPALGRTMHHYVCRACKTFKGWVVRPSGTKDRLLSAVGCDKAMVDPATGEVFCARKGSKTNQTPPELPESNADSVRHNHVARMWRRRDEYEACASMPLVRVHMKGALLQCYGRKLALCTRCARAAPFDLHHFFAEGFECGVCREPQQHQEVRTACFYCGAAAPRDPVSRGWCSATLTAQTAWLCPRHALPVVRHVKKRWTVTELQATLHECLAARPPRTRQGLRRRRLPFAAPETKPAADKSAATEDHAV